METQSKDVILSQVAAIDNRIKQVSQCYNSKQFTALFSVIGFDCNTDELFEHNLLVEPNDKEVTTFFEQYCTRLIAERNNLLMTLKKIEKIEGGK